MAIEDKGAIQPIEKRELKPAEKELSQNLIDAFAMVNKGEARIEYDKDEKGNNLKSFRILQKKDEKGNERLIYFEDPEIMPNSSPKTTKAL